MKKRLSKAQKAKNKRAYKTIRKYYEIARSKMSEEQRRRITYIGFKHRVQATMIEKDLNVRKASEKVVNSEAFTTPAERSRVNLKEAIREEFKSDWEELRKLSRDKHGRFKKVEENLEWNKERGGYVLGGEYFIDVSDSPKEIRIIKL